MKPKTKKTITFILLHLLFLFYSLISVCYKLASGNELFTFKFFFFYGILLILLFVYAIMWQQILKKLPLTVAYLNKAVVIIWGIIWGALIFHEKITWNMIVGSIIVVIGVCVVAYGKE